MLGLFGDVKESYRFGQLALKMRTSREIIPSSCPLTYMNCVHLQRPLSTGLEPLLSAYRVGLETGDLFFGSISLSCYCLVYLASGLPLRPFAKDMRRFGRQLNICRQALPLAFLCPSYQLALNLLGASDNPNDLSVDSIARHQAECFSDSMLATLDADDASNLYLLYLGVFNAYLHEDLELMESKFRLIGNLKERRFGGLHGMNYVLVLLDGLGGLWMCRTKGQSRKGKKLADNAIKELKSMVKTHPVNSINLLDLLKAEKTARKVPQTMAKEQWDRVISQFSRTGHIHYSAISNELAGKYMLDVGDNERAEYYLHAAARLYTEYGALIKVQKLKTAYDFLSKKAPIKETSRESYIQGKERFTNEIDSAFVRMSILDRTVDAATPGPLDATPVDSGKRLEEGMS